MLKSNCIYTIPNDKDGLRISIMSRHTLDDGISPDEKITIKSYDFHRPDLAPLPNHVGAYLKGKIDYNLYKTLYLDFLQEMKSEQVICLIKQSLVDNITVLCKELDPAFCHRKIFVEFAKDLAKKEGINLQIDIK